MQTMGKLFEETISQLLIQYYGQDKVQSIQKDYDFKILNPDHSAFIVEIKYYRNANISRTFIQGAVAQLDEIRSKQNDSDHLALLLITSSYVSEEMMNQLYAIYQNLKIIDRKGLLHMAYACGFPTEQLMSFFEPVVPTFHQEAA